MLRRSCLQTFPEIEFRSPESLGGSAVNILVYVENVDALVKRAVLAGATLARPVANQFYGDRVGVLKDPFGHSWSFASRIEDLTKCCAAPRRPRLSAAQRPGQRYCCMLLCLAFMKALISSIDTVPS